MHSALDVARYIINYSNKKDYLISNLKLQKLLYFTQAYYLAFTDSHKPCFPERIEAWNFGPVVPEVYHEFKFYGANHIPPVRDYYEYEDDRNIWSVKKNSYSDHSLPKKDRKIIEEVVDEFADYSASDLVTLTHDQKPWQDAYEPHMRNKISKRSIREYFEANE